MPLTPTIERIETRIQYERARVRLDVLKELRTRTDAIRQDVRSAFGRNVITESDKADLLPLTDAISDLDSDIRQIDEALRDWETREEYGEATLSAAGGAA